MEETVGKLWHHWITRLATRAHPDAEVRLAEMQRTLAIVFRALGGNPALRVAAAATTRHGARRRWLARLAGTGQHSTLASIDTSTLRLPPAIAVFPDRRLNRDLYLWLAALAASSGDCAGEADPWRRNQLAASTALRRWPGLAGRYRRLVAAHLAERPPPAALPVAQRVREMAIRHALEHPHDINRLPDSATPHQPVPLWLAGFVDSKAANDPIASVADGAASAPRAAAVPTEPLHTEPAFRAERRAPSREQNGLLMRFRAESLLSIGEFARVNRSEDDDADPDAESAAADLDQLAVGGDGQRAASRVRFDLDLPSVAEDDIVLGPGISLPEWDYRKSRLLPDHVRLQEMVPRDAAPADFPPALLRIARHIEQQLALLRPARHWARAQRDGSEIDLDAVVRATTDRLAGRHPSDHLYQCLEQRERDLCCLVLADLSLSTDAWISGEARVIDVVRDALLVFGQALRAAGDRFALCGFSSLRRNQVRFLKLKDFGAPFGATERGRVLAIKPGYYTRLGAAIRHATSLLELQPARRRVLLILSDGKPNDLDLYDGRYGIEDTRVAILAARARGLIPFCATIDREAQSYLPHLFGPGGYALIRRPEELPRRLPELYAQLTR